MSVRAEVEVYGWKEALLSRIRALRLQVVKGRSIACERSADYQEGYLHALSDVRQLVEEVRPYDAVRDGMHRPPSGYKFF